MQCGPDGEGETLKLVFGDWVGRQIVLANLWYLECESNKKTYQIYNKQDNTDQFLHRPQDGGNNTNDCNLVLLLTLSN